MKSSCKSAWSLVLCLYGERTRTGSERGILAAASASDHSTPHIYKFVEDLIAQHPCTALADWCSACVASARDSPECIISLLLLPELSPFHSFCKTE